MSYKSPIEIVYDDLKTRIEDNAYSVVQSYGINVDKEELLKALQYDREQYEEGYADGQREERTAKVEMLLCGNCHESNIFDVVTRQHYKYCPSCGCRLEWNEF